MNTTVMRDRKYPGSQIAFQQLWNGTIITQRDGYTRHDAATYWMRAMSVNLWSKDDQTSNGPK
jgi:hypothetical protein